MDIKKFTLSYYNNALSNFHIQLLSGSEEAEKLHTHEHFQIYYVLKGHLIHNILNEEVSLSSGDAFIIPPDIIHKIYVKSSDTLFYSFSLNLNFFKDMHDTLSETLLKYLENPHAVKPKITINSKEKLFVETLIERIMEEFTNQKPDSVEVIRSSTHIILTILSRTYFEEALQKEANFETNLESVMYCIDYINKHFTENITLKKMARLSTMSKSYFCSLFLELTGKPFKVYLNKLRIEKALKIINDNKLNNVAYLCG